MSPGGRWRRPAPRLRPCSRCGTTCWRCIRAGEVEVDVDAFEAAVARARETGELSDYRAALALHGGELLPEDRYEAWAAGRREAVSEAHLGLLLELSARLAEGGDSAAAIEALEQAVVDRPAARRRPPRADADVRRPTVAASRRWRSITSCARRFGASSRPSPTLRPHACIGRCCAARSTPTRPSRSCASRDARAAAARPAEPARHNLPVALTSFIGRDRELREVARLLDRHRLVTLTGAGRVGQDPSRPRGRDGARQRVPRRRLARGAGGPQRPRVGAGRDRLRARAHPPVPATGPRRPQRSARSSGTRC